MAEAKPTTGKWGKFAIWFSQNVIVPLVPLFIAVFVDVLIGVQLHWASSETGLVYTLVLPVLYLQSSRGAFSTTFFWITSVAGVVLFSVSHAMIHLAPARGNGLAYSIALALDIIYILTATVYEAIRTYRGDRTVE
jgi:hypothetical protein